MLKFSKWMYELGYQAAVRNVMHVIDEIPNEKPQESDMQARSEEQMKIRMKIALVKYDERQNFKRYMHQKFDPDYKAEIDDELLKIAAEL